MATAEELLASDQCTDILRVDLDQRVIIIPDRVTNIGVESDDSVLSLHFGMPRNYHGIDLSEFEFRINYENANNEGDLYKVNNLVTEEDYIFFDWVVGRHACTTRGNVEFSLCLRKFKSDSDSEIDKEFNTTTAVLPVLKGLETEEAVVEVAYDAIEQLIVDKSEEVKNDFNAALISYIEQNSELLRGPQGDPFTYDMFTSEQLELLRGPQGETIESVDVIQSAPNSGDTAIYEITTSTNQKFRFNVRNGYDGTNGRDGETITSFEQVSGTGAPGTRDVYSIKTSSGKDYRFSIYHGKNGDGAGDMIQSIYDPQGKNQDIFAYIDNKTTTSNLGDNPTGGVANDTVATWSNLGNGVAWISEQNQIVDQPSQYGFIINYVHDTDVFQIFHEQTDGETYFRSGDSINNWFQNWRRLLIANEKNLATEEYVDNKFTNLTSETFTFVMDDGTEKTVTVVTK